MLSRVADSIYWMSRYLERAENYSRFMDVNYNLSLELHPDISEQWKPLVVSTGDWGLYEANNEGIDKKNIIFFLGFDQNNPNSILNAVNAARENARSIRPEITKELWQQINGLYYTMKEGVEKSVWTKKDPRKFFLDIRQTCQLIDGIYNTTITRSDGWHFGKLGQYIERADKTSRVLDVKYHMLLPEATAVGTPLDLVQWSALLKSVSAYDMYRKKHGKINPANICDFLIFDESFPRSITHCVNQAFQSLVMIGDTDDEQMNRAGKRLGMLKSHLEYTDINEVLARGLHEFIDDIQVKLNAVSTAIFETYFSTENILKRQSQVSNNQ